MSTSSIGGEMNAGLGNFSAGVQTLIPDAIMPMHNWFPIRVCTYSLPILKRYSSHNKESAKVEKY